MAELPYEPPFELWKTDSGTDGWDSKTWLVAKFTTYEKADAYLTANGYTFARPGSRYKHWDQAKRHTMNQISYEIRPAKRDVPVDPKGGPLA
jgi:hypothetical protein